MTEEIGDLTITELLKENEVLREELNRRSTQLYRTNNELYLVADKNRKLERQNDTMKSIVLGVSFLVTSVLFMAAAVMVLLLAP